MENIIFGNDSERLTEIRSMQCQECGTEVAIESVFCPQCGNRLGDLEVSGDTAQDRFRAAVASRRQAGDDPEESIWEGRFSPKALICSWIVGGLITVACFLYGIFALRTGFEWRVLLLSLSVLWAVLGIRFLYLFLKRKYILTNQRLVEEQGILWKTIDRVELIDVDDITFKQNPCQRLVDCGAIEIMSSDVSHGTGRKPKNRRSDEGESNGKRRHEALWLLGIKDIRRVVELIERQRREERRRRAIYTEEV